MWTWWYFYSLTIFPVAHHGWPETTSRPFGSRRAVHPLIRERAVGGSGLREVAEPRERTGLIGPSRPGPGSASGPWAPGRAGREPAAAPDGCRTGAGLVGSRHVGCHERCQARGVPRRGACRGSERRRGHRGPDARRPGLVQLPAGRPADRADRPPVAQGRGNPRGRPVRPVRPGRQPALPLCQRGGAGCREEELDPAGRLAMARRYLGTVGVTRYVADNPDPGRENVA